MGREHTKLSTTANVIILIHETFVEWDTMCFVIYGWVLAWKNRASWISSLTFPKASLSKPFSTFSGQPKYFSWLDSPVSLEQISFRSSSLAFSGWTSWGRQNTRAMSHRSSPPPGCRPVSYLGCEGTSFVSYEECWCIKLLIPQFNKEYQFNFLVTLSYTSLQDLSI